MISLISRRYFLLVLTLIFVTHAVTIYADPFPPYWQGGIGAAVHYPPIKWPGDLQWNVYTLNGIPIIDKRDNDRSNGGTSPQNYVNVSSGCIDIQEPSVYWWFDHATNMICFRWRVEQIANTYAVGPKSGAFSSSDPWGSALWTVFFDIDGDGYREFAMFLNGSSGSPSEPVDMIVSVYSDSQSQSVDWETPGIYRLFHNPTAFVDSSTSMILNFQSSLSPIASWPNGKNETSWDYGSTRAVEISGCGEYFIDYQIPLDMFDATHVGGPKITSTTPFAMLFATANSLNNPLQKDLVYSGDLLGDPTHEASFGDMITFVSGPVVQPFVILMEAEGCQPVNIVAYIRDSFDCSTGTCISSVIDAKFYGYFDSNQNSLPDDNNEWTYIAPGIHSETIAEKWTASWDSSSFASGQYLIGAKGTDIDGNTTWGYLSETEVSNLFGGPPSYANISPDPGVVYAVVNNNCGGVTKNADLSIEKSVDQKEPEIFDTIVYTLLLSNHGPDSATSIKVKELLPSGISFVAASSQTYSPLSGVWHISELASTAQESLLITATVLESSEGSNITNTVAIESSNEIDTNATNDRSSAPISVKQILYSDLYLQKKVNISAAKPGDIIQYQIVLTNNGPGDATEISVQDNLSNDLIFVASSSETYSPSTGIWNIPTLPFGESISFTIEAQIIDTPSASLIANTASVVSLFETDTNTANNTASVQTSISNQQVSADLTIEKVADKSLFLSGDIICYTLAAKNNGPDDVPDTYVTENLPEGLAYVNHTTSQGNYYPYSNIWNIGNLSVNQTEILTLCARLASSILNEQVINRAQIFSSTINDPYLTNNFSESTSTRIGIVFRPDHEITTTRGSMVIFKHDFSIATGGQTGILSFDIESSQNLSWSIFYNTNNNTELDASDTLWNSAQSLSTMSGTIFLRAYIGNDIPNGWLDSTNVRANLIISNQTMSQTITDVTRVIDSNIGDMHAIKEVAVDTNCNTLLDDEITENQTFESSKSILPGECVIYRIHFINQGTGNLSHISIEDYTPQFSTFIAGSAMVVSMPQGLTQGTISTPDDNGTGLISWFFEGILLPGYKGIVSYQVKVGM